MSTSISVKWSSKYNSHSHGLWSPCLPRTPINHTDNDRQAPVYAPATCCEVDVHRLKHLQEVLSEPAGPMIGTSLDRYCFLSGAPSSESNRFPASSSIRRGSVLWESSGVCGKPFPQPETQHVTSYNSNFGKQSTNVRAKWTRLACFKLSSPVVVVDCQLNWSALHISIHVACIAASRHSGRPG